MEAEGGVPNRVIVLAGGPACGKGTQCDRIAERYGLVHISVGQILRKHVSAGTQLGEAASPFINDGQLVPNSLITSMIKERLCRPDVMKRGCLLDNYPVTVEQAKCMMEEIKVDCFIFIDVPDDVLVKRALGRRLDPHTGDIYHTDFAPAPPEIASRLVTRSDDVPSAVVSRLQTFNMHINTMLPFFESRIQRIDGTRSRDEVFCSIVAILGTLEWSTPSEPYFGNSIFNGPFTEKDALRAGFYSMGNPPEICDHVVCFRRGLDWQRQGIVTGVNDMISDGSGGLIDGEEGIMVTIDLSSHGKSFKSWAVFLAPVNDMEYSSICGTRAFQSSIFSRLYNCSLGIGDADPISKEDARTSLSDWLNNLEDGDGESFEFAEFVKENLLASFDEHTDGSLYLYSTNQKLGVRTSRNVGQDYSSYYRALNNAINSDSEHNLRLAMPLIQHMIYNILYDGETGKKSRHVGGRLWKGDVQRPVPLNMKKLSEAKRLGLRVRFRQFQSTTANESLARKYMNREDGRGYLWTIDLPGNFWGARDISNISWKEHEAETLFPPYSAFLVKSVDAEGCTLEAVDRRIELERRAERHGVRGSSAVEQMLGY